MNAEIFLPCDAQLTKPQVRFIVVVLQLIYGNNPFIFSEKGASKDFLGKYEHLYATEPLYITHTLIMFLFLCEFSYLSPELINNPRRIGLGDLEWFLTRKTGVVERLGIEGFQVFDACPLRVRRAEREPIAAAAIDSVESVGFGVAETILLLDLPQCVECLVEGVEEVEEVRLEVEHIAVG